VYRSLNHIYVQLIDDLKGVTLVLTASSTADDKEGGGVRAAGDGRGKRGRRRSGVLGKKRLPNWPNRRASPKVVFDRGGYIFTMAGQSGCRTARARMRIAVLKNSFLSFSVLRFLSEQP